jgi:hypothetical protein
MGTSLVVGVFLAAVLLGINLLGLILFPNDPYFAFVGLVWIVVAVGLIVRSARAMTIEQEEARASALFFRRARDADRSAPGSGAAPTVPDGATASVAERVAGTAPLVECTRCGTWESRADPSVCRTCGARIP